MAVKMRQPYLRHAFALPDAGTHSEPINIKDAIMDFYIRFYAQNSTTSNVLNTICRSWIELRSSTAATFYSA